MGRVTTLGFFNRVPDAGPTVVAGGTVAVSLCRTIGMSGDGRTQSHG